MKDDWTYRRMTGKEVLERALLGGGLLGLALLSVLGYNWSSGGVPVRLAWVALPLAVLAGAALHIVNRRERRAAPRSGAASV